jgi:hypothetical protein
MTASGLKLKKSGKSLVIPHSLHHKANTIVRFEAKLTTIIVISLHQGQRFRFFAPNTHTTRTKQQTNVLHHASYFASYSTSFTIKTPNFSVLQLKK